MMSSEYLLKLIIVIFIFNSNQPSCTCTKFLVGLGQPLEWWQETIVYQIYPRSFMDSNGDGIGDLKGIESKLDYLVELGIGTIWLSPIYTSPMIDFGYDVSNYTNVDPIFGSLNDFKDLVAAMKARGIKLIMDFILNHSSDQHVWFMDSIKKVEPYTDYYTWKDPSGYDSERKPIPPNNWLSMFGGSMWEWVEERQQFYLHQYAKEQPDLRLENPAVREAMMRAMEFWLDLGVDGFRMDAVSRLYENQSFPNESPSENAKPGTLKTDRHYWTRQHTFDLPQVLVTLAEFRAFLDNYSSIDGVTRAMMTEAYVHPVSNLMKYYGTEEMPIAHLPFNSGLITNKEFKAELVKEVVDKWMSSMPPGRWANWQVGNHDNARVASRFGSELIDAVNAILLLLPGTAITYYGEELGMTNTPLSWDQTLDPAGRNAGPNKYHLVSRDPERTPMQWDATTNAGFSNAKDTWLPLNTNFEKVNVGAQRGEKESHLKFYQSLTSLRKTEEWKYGELETLGFGDVFGFSRSSDKRGFLVLANLGNNATIFNATVFKGVPAIGTVYTRSVNFARPENIGSSVELSSLRLESKNSYVLTYVPEENARMRSLIEEL